MPSIEIKMDLRSIIILSLLSLTFVFVMYGYLKLNWGFKEMSASFFALGIVSGLIGKLGINRIGEAYSTGIKEVLL